MITCFWSSKIYRFTTIFVLGDDTVSLFHYSKGNDNFYTIDQNVDVSTSGYKLHGAECRIHKHQVPGTIPLYSYYRSGDQTHFYSTAVKEIGVTKIGEIGKYKFKLQRITGYCFPHQVLGSIPLHRHNNPPHFKYTTELGSMDGWEFRGRVECYVFPGKGNWDIWTQYLMLTRPNTKYKASTHISPSSPNISPYLSTYKHAHP